MNHSIMRRDAVEKLTGLKRSTIYEKMAKGTFPKCVPLTDKAVGWLQGEVETWLKQRVAVRDGEAV
jgi:prophage regulatory protein